MLHDLKLPTFAKDDFIVTAVEPWFKVKVQVIQEYLQAFLAETAGRVDEIVLIDFFSGSGFYAIGYQKEIVPMPSLLALQQDPPFTKVILNEAEPDAAKALKIRVNKFFRGRNVVLFEDNVDAVMEKLRFYVPPSKKNYKVAVLCLVDPFSLQLPFSFFEKMATQGYSFLLPYTFQLNSRMNHQYYLKEKRDELKEFIGPNATAVLNATSNEDFYKKLVRAHQNNMLTLGLSAALSAHKMQSQMLELPYFNVGLFSKQLSTKTIVREVKESGQQQFQLF